MSDSNAASFYFNANVSKSFNQTVNTALVALSSYICAEVYISNKTNDDLYIYDNNNFSDNNRFLLKNNESIIINGVTNTNLISAKTSLSTGKVYYRASRYSNQT
jgi:hypothetical protein